MLKQNWSNQGPICITSLKLYRYAAEIHFVHYNTKYGTFAESTKYEDGLAVLGVFVEVAFHFDDANDKSALNLLLLPLPFNLMPGWKQ